MIKENWWRGFKPSPLVFSNIVLVFFALILVISVQTDFTSHTRTEKIMVNPDLLKHSALGYTLLLADDIWIRLLQDIDFKDHKEKGWVYHMLDAITTLDNRYKIAYRAGATILSIIVDDKEGARLLFERGILNFPNDWALAYRASYHYLYEIKDCKRAAELLSQASQNGAPPWVAGLSSRLFVKGGQYELARSVILDTMERVKDKDEYYKQLQRRLNDLDQTYQNPNNKTLISGLDCH